MWVWLSACSVCSTTTCISSCPYSLVAIARQCLRHVDPSDCDWNNHCEGPRQGRTRFEELGAQGGRNMGGLRVSFLGRVRPHCGLSGKSLFEPIGFSVVRRYSNWRICAAVSVLEHCIVCPVVAIPLSVYPDQNPLVHHNANKKINGPCRTCSVPSRRHVLNAHGYIEAHLSLV